MIWEIGRTSDLPSVSFGEWLGQVKEFALYAWATPLIAVGRYAAGCCMVRLDQANKAEPSVFALVSLSQMAFKHFRWSNNL